MCKTLRNLLWGNVKNYSKVILGSHCSCPGSKKAGTGVSLSSWKEELHLNSAYHRASTLYFLTGAATSFHSIHGP